MGVREDRGLEPSGVELDQGGHHDAFARVEMARRLSSAVDEEVLPFRELDQGGVSLPDGEECDLEGVPGRGAHQPGEAEQHEDRDRRCGEGPRESPPPSEERDGGE